MDELNEGLLRLLISWRDKKAKELGYSNLNSLYQMKTLKKIATSVPTTKGELLKTYGVRNRNLDDFEVELLEVIKIFLGERRRIEKEIPRKSKKYSVEDIRKTFHKAYEKWSNADDDLLIKEYEKDGNLKRLSDLFARKPNALITRLKKLGLIDTKEGGLKEDPSLYYICGTEVEKVPSNSCKKCLGVPGYHCPNKTFPDCSCKYYFDKIFSIGIYRSHKERLGKAIWDYKETGKIELYKELGDLLLEYLERNVEIFSTIDMIVPIPAGVKSIENRGYCPVKLIIKHLRNRINFKINEDILIKRDSLTQKGLTKEKRILNVKGAYGINQENRNLVDGKSIILFDDIATTCSTINECSRLLKYYGATSVVGLTLGRTFKG